MIDLIRLSEEGFMNWLKSQLQKREFMYGHCFTEQETKENIYELLFQQRKTRVRDIEEYFIPFCQAGYLSPRQKLELMLFVLEKDYGNSYGFLYELEGKSVVRDALIEEIYLAWALEDRLILSVEEKREFFVQTLTDRIRLGGLEVLKRLALDGIMLGECCPPAKDEPPEKRAAICSNGKIIWMPFLAIEDGTELIRIIKRVVAEENRGELTAMDPFWECVREDGTCITAIRPPAAKYWGLKIFYGARKE